MKKSIVMILCLALLAGSFGFSLNQASFIYVGKKELPRNVAPFTADGILYLPLRNVAEALGYEVKWQQETKTVILKKDGLSISLGIGQNEYKATDASGHERISSLSASPKLETGHTFIPAEFVPTFLGQLVTLDGPHIKISAEEFHVSWGFVLSSEKDALTIGQTKKSALEESHVLTLSPQSLIQASALKPGDYVVAITSLISAKSLPPQTPTHMVYKLSQPAHAVGKISKIDKNQFSIVQYDVTLPFYGPREMLSNYYVAQAVEVQSIGPNTWIYPFLKEDFKARFAPMGGAIQTFDGKVEAVDEKAMSFTVKNKEQKMSFKSHEINVSVGDEVTLDYILRNKEPVALITLNKAHIHHLSVSKVERTADGHMILTTQDKKKETYMLTIDLSTQLFLNLSEIVPSSQITVYTNGTVMTSLPAQIAPLRITWQQ